MNKQEIIEKAKHVLAEEFEIDESIITPDASLRDTLGMDSLDIVDVVVQVQKNFGVVLKGEDFKSIDTFSDFYEMLDAKLNG